MDNIKIKPDNFFVKLWKRIFGKRVPKDFHGAKAFIEIPEDAHERTAILELLLYNRNEKGIPRHALNNLIKNNILIMNEDGKTYRWAPGCDQITDIFNDKFGY